jgi:isopenicillin N synthase-like dioxygenase
VNNKHHIPCIKNNFGLTNTTGTTREDNNKVSSGVIELIAVFSFPETKMTEPVIRRRAPRIRSRDGLLQFAKDNTSQNGEDGIIERIFQLLPNPPNSTRYCVDVGAWNGRHLSNTYSLLVSPGSNWRGVLIEADQERFKELHQLHDPLNNICIYATVSSALISEASLVSLLQQHANHLPKDFDFLCIDVDGIDYWLLHDLWKVYRPKCICIEANPTMPNDLIYIPARNDAIRHGASLAALVELAEDNGYVLVETTIYNAFFVQRESYEEYFKELVPNTSIEALHESTMGTSIYQLYDGTLKLWGCKKMLWHRIAIDEKKIQMLPSEKRNFPFAPPPTLPDVNAIDMSAYCISKGDEKRQEACANAIVSQLKTDGLALVKGTGISSELCHEALSNTHTFFNEADESVRRSCLTKDRARRGYSPMCTENFASLIGEQGPNDLVRKFRIGRTSQQSDCSPLLRPNVWPSKKIWDDESCKSFQMAVQNFYDQICRVAHAILRAICDGIIIQKPELASSLSDIVTRDCLDHTSILTLLGYRKGTRHKKTQKKRHVHPLVAAHTDVGVITVLLFDAGDCAVLQKETFSAGLNEDVATTMWEPIILPLIVPEDPIFVVNIADCLSDLSENYLPSTLHRVMPEAGSVPRNCLALFVGLDANERLTFGDTEMSYEDWRKQRIAKSQQVLKSKQQS